MSPDESLRLERLERQVAFLYQHAGLDPNLIDSYGGGYADGQPMPMPVAGLVPGPADCPPAVMEAIQRGNLIQAIKIYRELTGAGLREAKDAVDGWAGTGRRGRR